jgi:hypothetical protein
MQAPLEEEWHPLRYLQPCQVDGSAMYRLASIYGMTIEIDGAILRAFG